MAAVLRGEVDDRGRSSAAPAAPAALPGRRAPRPTRPAREEAYERRARQDPRRQHVRRQRRRAATSRRRSTDPTGLFSFDTRFLSKWVLTVNGERLNAAVGRRPPVLRDALLPRARAPGRCTSTRSFGDPPARGRRRLPRGADDPQPRRRSPSTCTVRIEADSDFADLFEVKDALEEEGHVLTSASSDGALRARLPARDLQARDGDLVDRSRAQIDEHGLDVRRSRIEPHGEWTTDLDVVTAMLGGTTGARSRSTAWHASRRAPTWQRDLERGSTTRRALECDWDPLTATYQRSLVDLAALRFSPLTAGRPQPPGRRAAVVHDDVRPRQHLHEPAGAAVHAGAGGDDAARARRSGRARGSTTSATRTRAGSCTRCATAR